MTSPRQQERLPAATAQQQHPTAGGKAPVKALPPGTPRNSALGGKQLPPGYGSRSSSDADDTDDEHGLLGSEGDGRVARSATATPASRFSSSGASAMDQGDDADESFAQYEDVSEVEDVHASDDGASDSADNSDAEDNNAMDLDRDDATDDFDDDEELSDDPGLFDDDEDDDDFSPKGARKSAKGRVTKPSVKAREAAGIVEPSTNGSSRAVTRIKLKTPAKTPTAAGKKVGAFGSKKGGSASKKTSGSKKAPAPRSEDKPSIANKAAHVPPPNANVEMEKIIYRRFTKPEAATTPVTAGGKVPSTAQAEPVEEFLIKFKNRSYMHCEWVTRKWIEENDKRGKQRVKYFLEKTIYDISYSLISEDRPFNDSYLKVWQ